MSIAVLCPAEAGRPHVPARGRRARRGLRRGSGAAQSGAPTTPGAASRPTNWPIASNVVCCTRVASSPEASVQSAGGQCSVDARNAAIPVERVRQPVADVALVDVEVRCNSEIEREVEIDVVGIIAQRAVDVRRQPVLTMLDANVPETPPAALRIVYVFET